LRSTKDNEDLKKKSMLKKSILSFKMQQKMIKQV